MPRRISLCLISFVLLSPPVLAQNDDDLGDDVDISVTRPGLTDLFDFHGGPDAAIDGAWSVDARWPIVAIHAGLLPDGTVLTYGTNELAEGGMGFVYDRWDPDAGLAPSSHLTLDVETNNNIFCSAQILLPGSGGLMLVTGGSVEKNGSRNFGTRHVNLFDPINNTFFKPAKRMLFHRWYPTVTQLGDGNVFVHGGRDHEKQPTLTPEIFLSDVGNWKKLTRAKSTGPWSGNGWNYPRSFLAPNNEVLVMPSTKDRLFYVSTGGRGRVRKAATLAFNAPVNEHLAVMYEAPAVLSIRKRDAQLLVMYPADHEKKHVVETVDVPDMETRRYWADATILPDGEVLVTGGATVNQSLPDAIGYVEFWNPTTQTWRRGASSVKSRLYHSTSLLLPNGTVLCAGGGPPGPIANLNAEVYYPPYLFNPDGSLRPRPRMLQVTSEPIPEIRIRARGDEGIEQMQLSIDGTPVKTFDVSQTFETYTCTPSKPVTADQLRVAFINDLYDPGAGFDANLTVDYLEVGETRYQTESPRVFAFENDDPRDFQHETLWANGYFEYWHDEVGYLQLGTIRYRKQVEVYVDRTGPVSEVRLIGFGSVTHSFDMGQRAKTLAFTQSGDKLTATMPYTRKEMPPGYYMMFIMGDDGTPSRAAMLELE